MSKQTYQEYLNSDHWQSVRARFSGRVCLVCDTDKEITLHHVTYARLGQELDRDLRPLCWPCHQAVHKAIDEGNRKLSHTDRHIERMRMERGANQVYDSSPIVRQIDLPKKRLSKKQRRKQRRRLAESAALDQAFIGERTKANKTKKKGVISVAYLARQFQESHDSKRNEAEIALAAHRGERVRNKPKKCRTKGKTQTPTVTPEQPATAVGTSRRYENPMVKILKNISRHRGIH